MRVACCTCAALETFLEAANRTANCKQQTAAACFNRQGWRPSLGIGAPLQGNIGPAAVKFSIAFEDTGIYKTISLHFTDWLVRKYTHYITLKAFIQIKLA